MKAATLAVPRERSPRAGDHLRQVILARIAAGGGQATRAILAQELGGIVPHGLPGAQWAALLSREVETLVLDGLAIETGPRLTATEAGAQSVRRFLGIKGNVSKGWDELRDVRLVAKALGLERAPVKDLKSLLRADGLRAAIVQSAYKLKIKGIATPSRLRSALAGVALERAFGNQLSTGLSGKGGLSPKAGRLLAGQLSRSRRDFGTDGRLVAALAGEHLGVRQTDIETLRRAVLRRYLEGAIGELPAAVPAPPRSVSPAPAFAVAMPALPPGRPDLSGFVREVQRHAETHAQGWAGDRKAYISHVWRALAERHPDWGLSKIEFEGMLVEAHRAGRLALANADLKDRAAIKDVQESAVVYKNTVFHFVRVDG